MTSRAEYDVIQIDIYPSLQNDIACESESGVELDIMRSPHLTSSRVSPALSHQSRLSYPEVCCRILPFSRLTPSDVISSAYKEYGYPWYDRYDEHIPGLQPTGRFLNLPSVLQLDTSCASAVAVI